MSDLPMPWDRKLLSVAEETSLLESVPAAAIVGIAAVISLIIALALCVCDDNSSGKPELKEVKPRKGPSSYSFNDVGSPAHVNSVKVEDEPQIRPPSTISNKPENGGPTNRNSGAPSRSSQISVGSGQARPQSLRELPELPGNVSRPLSSGENGVQQRINEDDDDYDHLGTDKQVPRVRANYDHIEIESPNGVIPQASGSSEMETPSGENYYAQVRERNYEIVSDIKRRGVDPYDRIKDGPYAKLKEDPYSKMKDDPYAMVKDVDPYAKVKDVESPSGGQVSVTDIDPYATVNDEGNVRVVEVMSLRTSANTDASATSDNVIEFEELSPSAEPEPSVDYAVVTKPRNHVASNFSEPIDETDPYTVPPEPPRAYTQDEATGGGPPLVGAVGGAPAKSDNAERKYSMVTARESLASMTARNALNPYETVPEVENMYATVDGGSGDGVVKTSDSPKHEELASHDTLTNRLSAISDTYAEIQGTYETIPAPVPPSLETLHMVTKIQDDKRHLASPEDSGISGSSCDYDKRYSFSPSATRLPDIPNSNGAGPLENGTAEDKANGVTLDPNYQTVKDCITYIDEVNDPNYESVEEAKAKPPARRDRRHVYEEVSPTSATAPGFEAASDVRERVLQGHMYEDIHEIKEQRLKAKRKSGGNEKR